MCSSPMNVSLTPELEQFVSDQVKTGFYRTSSEVIREALRKQIQGKERMDLEQRLSLGRQQIEEGRAIKADKHFFDDKRQRIKDQCSLSAE